MAYDEGLAERLREFLQDRPGIGEKKLERYGPRFLELLRTSQRDA